MRGLIDDREDSFAAIWALDAAADEEYSGALRPMRPADEVSGGVATSLGVWEAVVPPMDLGSIELRGMGSGLSAEDVVGWKGRRARG